MNHSLTITAAEDMEIIVAKCYSALDHVTWRCDILFDASTTITLATQYARQGHDAGLEAMLDLAPPTTDFHEWINYALLCTVLYNRDNEPQRFTILRIVIKYPPLQFLHVY